MNELRIAVCIKQVSDPEGPDSAFAIDPAAKLVTPVGIPPVINPFDERALEAALQLKERFGARVTALNIVDEKLAMPVLRKALAAGADELIILKDEAFVSLDSPSAAYVLACAIRRIGGCSLILVGRQAADWGFGQVGPILAEVLGITSIGVAQRLAVEDGTVLVERLKRTGYEVLKSPFPVLVAMDADVELRLPSLKEIRGANTKPVTTWGASDLGIDPARLFTRNVWRLSKPPSRKRQCFMANGETVQEKGERLALKLRSDRVI